MSVAPKLAPGPTRLQEWASLDEDDRRELVDGYLEEAEVPDYFMSSSSAF